MFISICGCLSEHNNHETSKYSQIIISLKIKSYSTNSSLLIPIPFFENNISITSNQLIEETQYGQMERIHISEYNYSYSKEYSIERKIGIDKMFFSSRGTNTVNIYSSSNCSFSLAYVFKNSDNSNYFESLDNNSLIIGWNEIVLTKM
jgi:hypothetical protein